MTTEANGAPIRAGIVCEGTSNLRWHALRSDKTAACSDYILVSDHGDLAKDVLPQNQCRSRACQKLFKASGAKTP